MAATPAEGLGSEGRGAGSVPARIRAFARAHPFVGLSFLGAAACGVALSWAATTRAEPVKVTWEVPEAPRLTAEGAGQTVYRIDASRSSVSYEVEEKLAGTSRTAVGTTRGIAGDILVDDNRPSASRVGEVVINVEQLTSDQSLRDERLRSDYLSSRDHPLVRYRTDQVRGLPEHIADGTDYTVTLAGDLTVKTTTRPVEVEATVRRQEDELRIKGTAHLKLSDFDLGPISVIGLVSTGDDATLRLDLLAPDASQLNLVTGGAESAGAPVAGAGDPSFAKTVQPVLERRCAGCHQPGGAGSGTWELATAGDAARIASGIGLVTETRYMPPWLASDGNVPLQHSMRLGDDELRAVQEWAKVGGPLDVDPSTRITAAPEEVPSPRHDLDLRLAEPYVGSVDKPNDYRCFVLDLKLTEPAAVTGYGFVPDHLPIEHHALVYRLHARSLPDVADAEARDDRPGWECFGGINLGRSGGASLSGGGGELVMGWAPGQPPTPFPEGAAIKLDPGDIFVIQMHYHVSEAPPPDQPGVFVQLGERDLSAYDTIKVATYLAPAEIPCLPGATAPRCDRDAELQALQEQYGPVGPTIANGLHMICGTTPDQLAHLDGTIARASCDTKVRHEGQILAVLGHMHEIGKTFRMTLNPGTPGEKVLLDIPRWDFDWQFNYALAEHINVTRGDVIRVECSWDRALVHDRGDPHHITWAEGTEDEMCFSTVSTRVAKPPEGGPTGG